MGPLVRELLAQGDEIDVWVADDGSPDGTAEAVRTAAAEHPGRVEARAALREGGAGSGGHRRLQEGARRPETLRGVPGDGRGLLPPPARASQVLREARGVRHGRGLALRGGGRHLGVGRPATAPVVAGEPLRRARGWRAHRRHDERLSRLPARRARRDRVRSHQDPGLRRPRRDRVPGLGPRVPARRGADPLQEPRARGVQALGGGDLHGPRQLRAAALSLRLSPAEAPGGRGRHRPRLARARTRHLGRRPSRPRPRPPPRGSGSRGLARGRRGPPGERGPRRPDGRRRDRGRGPRGGGERGTDLGATLGTPAAPRRKELPGAGVVAGGIPPLARRGLHPRPDGRPGVRPAGRHRASSARRDRARRGRCRRPSRSGRAPRRPRVHGPGGPVSRPRPPGPSAARGGVPPGMAVSRPPPRAEYTAPRSRGRVGESEGTAPARPPRSRRRRAEPGHPPRRGGGRARNAGDRRARRRPPAVGDAARAARGEGRGEASRRARRAPPPVAGPARVLRAPGRRLRRSRPRRPRRDPPSAPARRRPAPRDRDRAAAAARPAVLVLVGWPRDERRALLAGGEAAGVASVVLRLGAEDPDDLDRADGGPRARATVALDPGGDPAPALGPLREAARATLGPA